MPDAEKGSKRPDQYSRTTINFVAWLIIVVMVLAVVIIAYATGIMPLGPSEFDILSSPIPMTNAATVKLIMQTNAAATQFFLATTSPNALTPTPSP